MKKNAVRNAFYAQSGGVSAVINASACGVIETAMRSKRIGKVYAGRDGIVGALTEDLIDVGRESPATIRALRYTPAGVCLSARMVARLSRPTSIRSSVSAPMIPSRPAYTWPILLERSAVSITPQAEALMTADTPPDWA